jgi:hypothetical protein
MEHGAWGMGQETTGYKVQGTLYYQYSFPVVKHPCNIPGHRLKGM